MFTILSEVFRAEVAWIIPSQTASPSTKSAPVSVSRGIKHLPTAPIPAPSHLSVPGILSNRPPPVPTSQTGKERSCHPAQSSRDRLAMAGEQLTADSGHELAADSKGASNCQLIVGGTAGSKGTSNCQLIVGGAAGSTGASNCQLIYRAGKQLAVDSRGGLYAICSVAHLFHYRFIFLLVRC